MPIIFHISSPLRAYAGGCDRVELAEEPATLREALSSLWLACPDLRDRLFDEQGDLRPHVNLFVGPESIRYSGGMETPLSPGSEISILPAVSGGACPKPRI